MFGLFLGLVYCCCCNDGEWRKEYLCPPTLRGSACLERFALTPPPPPIERRRDSAADPALRLRESSREQRNEAAGYRSALLLSGSASARVFGLFLGLVYCCCCNDGEWRKEYICPPTLRGSACLERFALTPPPPPIERRRDSAADPALRLRESSREQRNERCTGGKGRSLIVFYSRSTPKVCASGYARVSTSCRKDMER